jgi:hypothetical protein
MLIQRCALGRQIRLLLLLAVAVGLLGGASGAAQAQSAAGTAERFAFSAGYSYVRANSAGSGGASNLQGGSASGEIFFTDAIGLVADFGGYHFTGQPTGLSANMYSYMFGPRFTLRKSSKWLPFAQVLAGGGRLNASSGSVQAGENGFALAAGGGIDIHLKSHFDIRAAQVEYFMTRFPNSLGTTVTQNNLRVSAGIVFWFGGR